MMARIQTILLCNITTTTGTTHTGDRSTEGSSSGVGPAYSLLPVLHILGTGPLRGVVPGWDLRGVVPWWDLRTPYCTAATKSTLSPSYFMKRFEIQMAGETFLGGTVPKFSLKVSRASQSQMRP
jgi:hypothetical protein